MPCLPQLEGVAQIDGRVDGWVDAWSDGWWFSVVSFHVFIVVFCFLSLEGLFWFISGLSDRY